MCTYDGNFTRFMAISCCYDVYVLTQANSNRFAKYVRAERLITVWSKVGTHDIIRTLSVSADICFTFNYLTSASTPISADMTTDKIIVECILLVLSSVINIYDMFYTTWVQVLFFFCTRNEYYITLSFVFNACMRRQANTVRVCITTLCGNSLQKRLHDLCN